jgi:hypothetical protein
MIESWLFLRPAAYEDHAVRVLRSCVQITSRCKDPRIIGAKTAAVLTPANGYRRHARDSAGCSATDTVNWLRAYTCAAPNGNHALRILIDHQKNYFHTGPAKSRNPEGRRPTDNSICLLAPGKTRTSLEAGTQKRLTPFVGRHRELAAFRDHLMEAAKQRGQIVLLAGEPGVGKSRLLLEFRKSLKKQEVTWLAARSLAFGTQMAYLPIIDLLKRLFLVEETDNEVIIAGKIDAGMVGELRSASPFVKYLMSVDPGDESVLKMEPQQRRIRTFLTLRQLIFRQAQTRPLILVIEDLHWLDKTSEDFLVSLADAMPTTRLLLLVTFRSEYRNLFPERSYITRLTLRQLSDEESVELARGALAGAALPAAFATAHQWKGRRESFFRGRNC